MKKIVLLQTSMVSFETFNRLFGEIIPEAEISNLVDEDLLNTLNRNKGITTSIIQRIVQYCVFAEAAGADLIFSQCSSTREGIECVRKIVQDLPVGQGTGLGFSRSCGIGEMHGGRSEIGRGPRFRVTNPVRQELCL